MSDTPEFPSQSETTSSAQPSAVSAVGEGILRIRQLRPRDAEAFRYLRLRCIEEDPTSFSVLREEEEKMTLAQVHSLLERFLHAPHSAIWGAFSREYLVGIIGLEPLFGLVRQHRGIVTSLCVLPEYRGQSVGRALIAHLIREARQIPQLESLVLEVSETSGAAAHLYQQAGFVQNGREPGALAYGARRLDLLRMTLPLKKPGLA